ncbi:MAG: DNA polymerase III subunit alpha [Deltaproteobacteria bacterium]|nr:DNA polymerase III subunit alpha [Deltaproteobacteria bacterium]
MHHSKFVHLHLHTQYSLLDGAIRHDALIAIAKEYKMPAVAVTDHGNLFGAVEFYKKAMAAGIKPIIGCETYIAPGSRMDKTPPSRGGSMETAYHLVLLVKNAEGYVNLCKLLSKAYIEGFYYRPRIDKELLRELNGGLIALSACLHGEVAYYAGMGQMDAALKAAAEYKEIFPNKRFYLELQENGMEEQRKVNKGLIEISRKLDIPVVATNDCHYLRKEDSKVHDILLCIQTGTTVNSSSRMKFPTDEFYVKTPDEMINAFKDIPEAIENTIAIAERCNFEMKLGENHLPEFPLPQGETVDSLIEIKSKAGLEKRLSRMAKRGVDVESVRLNYYDRLQKELKVISGMGSSGYFLIVNDFIEHARGKGIPVGPGRGSAAGSLVAYSLGITNLDPIKYNLLFERFLNPDRISLPDIDIDFCFEKRDEVIKYVTGKYGADNVTQIITFGQLRARACIRDVGRALDMPYADVDRIAKLVPAAIGITIETALQQEPKLLKLTEDDARVRQLIEVAKALEGLPRHASTHAAGVVISNKPLTDYLPLYRGPKENIITTQYPMKDVERIGLVKFDFLGLKTLTVIDKTIRLIKANRGADIDIDDLALDDRETYELIASGNTNGVFQLESSGIKELLRKLKPEIFEDLIAAVALYRPGPLQSGMVDDFINRKHKRVKILYDVPELEDILDNTYGVMVYQEQVMQIARTLAGFTPGDADFLRKAMGKKLPEEMVIQKSKFLDGAHKLKVPPKKAEKIFDLMAKFAGYGFNKSHSAAYALIAFQTGYLKAHYRVEFMAALMTSAIDDTDSVVKYINECRVEGITVAPPDLNESSKEFTVHGDRIRFGLAAVKNVGSAAIDEILGVRQSGPFTSVMDFLGRVDSRKVNKKVIESLIKCGAFDFASSPRVEPSQRAAVFASLDSLMDAAGAVQRDRESGQVSIFDMLGASSKAAPAQGGEPPQGVEPLQGAAGKLQNLPEWPEKERLQYEKETLGFYLSSHPLAGLKKELDAYATCSIADLMDRRADEEVTVGGIAAEIKEITTKKGDRMAFLRIEDLTGGVETVVFSDIYRKVSEMIASGAPLLVSGRLEKDEEKETVKITATGISLLEEAKASGRKANPLRGVKSKGTHITLKTDGLDAEKFFGLKKIMQENAGPSPVFLHLVYPEGRDAVNIAVSDDLRINPAEDTLERIKGFIETAEIKVI